MPAARPLGTEIFAVLPALGLNLKQVYGQTETSGICVLHPDGEVRAETVGKPTPGTRIRISDERRGARRERERVRRLLQEPDATRSALEDGWLRTGDAGLVDDEGHLVVIDRLQTS